MKRFVLVVLFVLVLCLPSWGGDYLACDLHPEGDKIVASQVEVNGSVVEGIWQASLDGTAMLLLDLAPYENGSYVFRARVRGSNGWWSDWSDPFEAGKPAGTGNLKVIEE